MVYQLAPTHSIDSFEVSVSHGTLEVLYRVDKYPSALRQFTKDPRTHSSASIECNVIFSGSHSDLVNALPHQDQIITWNSASPGVGMYQYYLRCMVFLISMLIVGIAGSIRIAKCVRKGAEKTS
jgi:hypothetical protein